MIDERRGRCVGRERVGRLVFFFSRPETPCGRLRLWSVEKFAKTCHGRSVVDVVPFSCRGLDRWPLTSGFHTIIFTMSHHLLLIHCATHSPHPPTDMQVPALWLVRLIASSLLYTQSTSSQGMSLG